MRKLGIEQGSHQWHQMRQGIVTGTSLKSALGTPKVQETLLYQLVAERMTEPQIIDISSAAVERGNELEPIARRVVRDETGIDFQETGMLFSDDLPGFGFSPDAICEDGGEIIGGLEIKCPGSKKHVEYIVKNELPKEYYHQVMAPFLMSDKVQFWYFASYDDRNYERPLFLLKVTRSQFDGQVEACEKLLAFVGRVEDAHAALSF
jgi:putative phage-type endonuclease